MVLFLSVQIIIVAKLSTDVVCPTLLTSSYEFEHTTFVHPHVAVDATEVVPMVFHTAVLFASTGEVEASPCLNFFRLVNLSQAVEPRGGSILSSPPTVRWLYTPPGLPVEGGHSEFKV